MLVLQHKKLLVEACYPQDEAERIWLWSQIKPVKFSRTVTWQGLADYTLAAYQVPDEAAYNVVLRVECYTVNFTAAAADYGMFEPPPQGFAFWRYVPYGVGATYDLTSTLAPVQQILDCDEFLFFKGGYNVTLIGRFIASTDGGARDVRTLVYSYNISGNIADRLGASEMEIPLF